MQMLLRELLVSQHIPWQGGDHSKHPRHFLKTKLLPQSEVVRGVIDNDINSWFFVKPMLNRVRAVSITWEVDHLGTVTV